ncbi:RidA family protein [Pelagimonas sp. KU-00592-HH]|uniref:RidA family protein n=1 Tax=Pelagimonas sp. KU-00592-HH TaxID=3127651 RepID=UPI003107C7A1
MKALNPDSIAPPFAAYSHGIDVTARRLVATSGQLGLAADGSIPEGAEAQADICLANIDAILAEAGLDRTHIIRLNAFVTGREHMAGYMVARDRYLAGVPVLPASTLVIVSGFTRPEFVVEIEVLAAESA